MKDEIIKDEIIFDAKTILPNKKKSQNIMDELDDMDSGSVLLSSMYNTIESSKPEKVEDDTNNIDDDWDDVLDSLKAPKIKKKKVHNVVFGDEKKKKKKKKSGEPISHRKEFETEMTLLRNLQIEQSKFVDSLQKTYDALQSTRSTSRGVGKYTTDLIDSISTARSLSMQLVDKIISTKKTIADLDFKERKEFGSKGSSEQENMSNYAATYLKTMVNYGRNNIVNGDGMQDIDGINSDVSEDELFSSISDSLGETDRSEEIQKYLEYEGSGIQIYVRLYPNYEPINSPYDYEYIAYDNQGNIVSDYPLPEKTKLSINRSNNTVSDAYGNKYCLDN